MYNTHTHARARALSLSLSLSGELVSQHEECMNSVSGLPMTCGQTGQGSFRWLEKGVQVVRRTGAMSAPKERLLMITSLEHLQTIMSDGLLCEPQTK
jgi:hypothetical protein